VAKAPQRVPIDCPTDDDSGGEVNLLTGQCASSPIVLSTATVRFEHHMYRPAPATFCSVSEADAPFGLVVRKQNEVHVNLCVPFQSPGQSYPGSRPTVVAVSVSFGSANAWGTCANQG
jgi:hypothetical protein